jgi:hypothetical protein
MRILKADYEVHGYTDGCRGCSAMRRSALGIPHTAACRARMETALAATPTGADRVRQSEDRITAHRARAEERDDGEHSSKRQRIVAEGGNTGEPATGADSPMGADDIVVYTPTGADSATAAQTRKAEDDGGQDAKLIKSSQFKDTMDESDTPGAASSSTSILIAHIPQVTSTSISTSTPSTPSTRTVPTMPTREARDAQRATASASGDVRSGPTGATDVDMAAVGTATAKTGATATTADASRADARRLRDLRRSRSPVSITANPGDGATQMCVSPRRERPEVHFDPLEAVFGEGAAARWRPDVAEVYSPPRVTKVAAEFGLVPGWSLDLTTVDRHGVAWDFTRASRRKDARDLLEATRPRVLIGSPMCTAFSALLALSASKRDPEVVRRLRVEAEVHLRFSCELYELQIRRGDYFVHEHPAGATSWKCECIRRMMSIPGVIATVADQCQYGLTSKDELGVGAARKATRFLTNAPYIAEELNKRCPGDHRHVHLISGRASGAQRYPHGLCAAFCRGAANQLRKKKPLEPRDEREIRERIKERTLEEKIRRKDLGVQEISTMTHQDTEAWDDVKQVWLDPSKVKEARAEEMDYVRKMKVYDKVLRSDCPGKPIPVRWVDTNKGTEGDPNYRSRVVAKELKATHPGDPAELYAATPPLEAVKVVISHAASGGRKRALMIIDIRRAYFNAPARRPVYIEIPPEDWEPGDEHKCARLNSSLYGTRDAARNWEEELTKFMLSQGAVMGKSSSCVYDFKIRGIKVSIHGDDIVCAGEPEDLDWLRDQFIKKFEVRVQELSDREQGSQEIKVLNRVIRRTSAGITIEADPRHATSIIEHLGLVGANGVSTPCEVQKNVTWTEGPDAGCEVLEREGSAPLGVERARLYRGVAARLNYLAQDRPDLKFAALRASRNMSEPHEGDFEILKRVGRYLISRPRATCLYKWQNSSKNVWVCTDSDWAGDKKTRKSTTGGCMWHGSHLLKVWAKTQHAISLSSAEAELYAAVHGTAEALGMQSILKDLGISATVNVGMDASAALGLINRQGLGKARHIETQWLWIQQATREGRVLMSKIPGKENPADLFTKPLNQEMIDGFMTSLGFHYPL